ncbi:MAG: hypothetical protein DWQ44_13560 [Bacteroidetes bacterium]|nr:MAG: hypothetical protein DWQ33_08370 [Bacteroidota bacterium]REK05712.1 MAG: hypothetical protein DWQ39_04685 [Bacteroidota bacterium]REK31982.1 MAG: hypothetical protein DWQ44_13560 [Bacteroidota bacterium]REK50046.1 MAG: hypothetical protein DWQ48_05780 [Bacteroidota bacterium]
MKKRFLFYLLPITFTNFCYSQINYEPGYFIDNAGVKTECLIKNLGWKNNPESFIYKTQENAAEQKAQISEVKEFSVSNKHKFIRHVVHIDRSGYRTEDLNIDMNPVWTKDTLFLKVLIDGEASLFYFEKDNLQRYFFLVPDSAVRQLVYKKYLIDENRIAENNMFRQQLWNEVKCGNVRMEYVNLIPYHVKELVKYFRNYNSCKGNDGNDYYSGKSNSYFNFKITLGAASTTVNTINKVSFNNNFEFGNSIVTRYGAEFEFMLPYNNNKWSLFIDPSFQYYEGSGALPHKTGTLKFKSLDFPAGLRFYFFLPGDIKLFVNAIALPLSFDFGSQITFDGDFSPFDVRSFLSFAAGGGVDYGKFSLEGRHYSNRDIFINYVNFKSEYHRSSVILGFKLINGAKRIDKKD